MAKKNKRIFYPDQPVPTESFVGRASQVHTLMEFGVAPALEGSPKAMFIRGEYGLGKSSLASYVQSRAEEKDQVYGIYASLSGAYTLPELARTIVRSAMEKAERQASLDRATTGLVQEVKSAAAVLTATRVAVRQEETVPTQETSTHVELLNFLRKLQGKLFTSHTRAIVLILDEIDMLAPERVFAPFVKGLMDTNAIHSERLPLLLLVCGVRRCWQQMLQAHPSIERVFETVEIPPMSLEESEEFYRRSFAAGSIDVSKEAIKVFHAHSGGVPRIMHLLGEKAYRADKDHFVDLQDAMVATTQAAQDYGEGFIRERIREILHTRTELIIIHRIGKLNRDKPRFVIDDMTTGLSEAEREKLPQFLDNLVQLEILRPGETRDEYEFCLPIVQLYFWLVAKNNLRL